MNGETGMSLYTILENIIFAENVIKVPHIVVAYHTQL
jgi:carbonic anhydrase